MTTAPHCEDAGECAKGGDQINRKVQQDTLDALFRPRGKPDQHISHIRNRAVRHQPFDIGLADSRHSPQCHREDRNQHDEKKNKIDDVSERLPNRDSGEYRLHDRPERSGSPDWFNGELVQT